MGIRLAFSLVALLAFLFMEWYTGKGFRLFAKKHLPSAKQRHAVMLYKLSNYIVLGFLAVGILALIFKNKDTYSWASYLLGGIMLIILPKMTYAAFIFFEDAVSLVRHVARRKYIRDFQPERRKFISQLGFIASMAPLATAIHGMVWGRYAFEVHELQIAFKDLPEAFDGFRLAQFSDFHSGSFDQKEPVVKGLEMLQDLEPDLIVFTGDMVNDFAEEVEDWKPHLAKLHAPFGKFSVLGNHDYGESVRWPSEEAEKANLERLKAFEKEMGFHLLLNEHVRLEKAGSHFNLIGVENWGKPPFPQKGDLDKATAGIREGEFNLLLSHDPSHWEARVLPNPTKIHLTLSGHTHGAQMGVETPGWKWSPVQYYYPQWAGLYEREGQFINVNRGFGYVGPPARMGIWPEITLITLVRA